jgi:uncharacterized protein YgiM (DUF1202 family)
VLIAVIGGIMITARVKSSSPNKTLKSPAAGVQTENVSVDLNVNMRSGPTINSTIIMVVKSGTKVSLLSKADNDGWIQIGLTDAKGNYVKGYIKSKYLTGN